MSNRHLSLHEFKNWLATQQDLSEFFSIGMGKEDPNEEFIGRAARSTVSEQKLLERVETEDDLETVVAEFLEQGATVLCVEDKRVQLEVESGTFYAPRFCVKILKGQ